MFGRAESIRDALPRYIVDYQERAEARVDQRWIDRLVPNGSWSGNVYAFFRTVYQKLTADLKVPFQLHEGQRLDDTPVHEALDEALREALVNTLIHADYSGRVSVLMVKQPDMFGFRNPGRMRIEPELAVLGGNSDCRNRRLQTMFQLVGYGDHAGSGLPKIYKNWAGQHWRQPVLYEMAEPEQTLMELRMSSLVPPQALAQLESRLVGRFRALSETARARGDTSRASHPSSRASGLPGMGGDSNGAARRVGSHRATGQQNAPRQSAHVALCHSPAVCGPLSGPTRPRLPAQTQRRRPAQTHTESHGRRQAIETCTCRQQRPAASLCRNGTP